MKFWRKPLDADRVKSVAGEVIIIKDRCKGCGFCIEYCPRGVLEFSEEFNSKGYHPPRVKDADACVNCGLCEMICPEFAIFSIQQEKDEGQS
ncbi:MAG TPA: 4Fe-4S dicluster domain-containing protein [bacterium (Candidatus Stahlbacteria)]|nr:4Fe-4S dicluster domain-containing protein [Candidatus Stahlbacteria bacterium]